MIDKKNILAMSRAVFRKGQGYPDRRLIHPNREWVLGLILFTIVVLGGSIAVTNVFSKYGNSNIQNGEVTNKVPVYHAGAVKEALEIYSARSLEYTRLKANKVVVPVAEESTEEVLMVATSTEAVPSPDPGTPVLQ